MWKDSCRLRFSAYPTSDQPLRQRVIGRLTADPEEFDLKLFRKAGLMAEFTTLFVKRISNWPEGDQPKPTQVVADLRYELDKAWTRWASIPDALRPIFDERYESKSATNRQR